MNTNTAISEIFITAFKSLPKREKETVAEKILCEVEGNFTEKEWDKIEKLCKEPGKLCSCAKEAKKHIAKL